MIYYKCKCLVTMNKKEKVMKKEGGEDKKGNCDTELCKCI